MKAVGCTTDITDRKWLEKEFRHVKFKDKRLVDRLIKTSNLLESKASGAINQSCKRWKDAKGAYRLFSNDKFNVDEVYASHYREIANRIRGQEFVLAIQDTSYLDYDTHIKTKELGSVSKAYTKHKKGLIMHSTLVVTRKGLPLGLISQQCLARPVREEGLKEKARRRYVTAIEDKESYKWIMAFKETANNVPKDTQVITVGDREADIFEFLWQIQSSGSLFVIRNRQDRKFICSEGSKTKISTHLAKQVIKKEIRLEVPKKGNNKSRIANVEVKYIAGCIPVRSASIYGSENRQRKINDRISLYVVSAKEINPPNDVEAIDWTLLTNVTINSMEDAIERINCYKLRWKIEEYFRILKANYSH